MSVKDSVVLETSMGDVQLELYWDHAPKVRSCISTSKKFFPHSFVMIDMQKLCGISEKRVL